MEDEAGDAEGVDADATTDAANADAASKDSGVDTGIADAGIDTGVDSGADAGPPGTTTTVVDVPGLTDFDFVGNHLVYIDGGFKHCTLPACADTIPLTGCTLTAALMWHSC